MILAILMMCNFQRDNCEYLQYSARTFDTEESCLKFIMSEITTPEFIMTFGIGENGEPRIPVGYSCNVAGVPV